jgi:hypothetical protein
MKLARSVDPLMPPMVGVVTPASSTVPATAVSSFEFCSASSWLSCSTPAFTRVSPE